MAVIATLRSIEEAHVSAAHPIASIPLTKLTPWPGNVCRTGASDQLEELIASIAAVGLLQPLVVRKTSRNRHLRRGTLYRNRPSTTLGLLHPPMQHRRIEPTCQGHGRDRHAGLLACAHRFGLKMGTVHSPTTTTGLDHLCGSIHVNAYLLG